MRINQRPSPDYFHPCLFHAGFPGIGTSFACYLLGYCGDAGVRQILILLVGATFACHLMPGAKADSYFSRLDPDSPSATNYWSVSRLTDTWMVSRSYAEWELRFYRPQHRASGTATGYGVGYRLNDLPFSSWLAERKIFHAGMAYNPRDMKFFLTIETKSWGYAPIPSSSTRYSDPDVDLAGTDITDRFYQILFNIPF